MSNSELEAAYIRLEDLVPIVGLEKYEKRNIESRSKYYDCNTSDILASRKTNLVMYHSFVEAIGTLGIIASTLGLLYYLDVLK